MDYHTLIINCSRATKDLYVRINNNHNLKDKVKFIKNKGSGHFSIEFIRPANCVNMNIYGMSIAYPIDTIGNQYSKYDEHIPSTIETVLLGKIPNNSTIYEADIIYDDNCGYVDNKRFLSDESLIEEIIRVYNYLIV